MENASLNNKFSSPHWFIGEDMTIKEFLDYVLEHEGDFVATTSRVSVPEGFNADGETRLLTFYTGCTVPVLSDSRYSRRMTSDEVEYLAAHSEYFAARWGGLIH